MSAKSYYDVLEVSASADEGEIKKAYMKLSLKYHPDRNQNKEESTSKFQEINEAYEVLKDPQKRARYDAGFGGEGGDEMADINNLFNMMFGGKGFGPGVQVFHMGGPMGPMGMGNMNMGPMGMGPMGMGMGPMGNMNMNMGMGDVFGDHIFQQLQKPPPIIKNISIPIEKAYYGGNIFIEVERTVLKNGLHITELENMSINIPQGIRDDELIVLRGCGNVLNEQISGDLKIIVKIINQTEFQRQGNDLYLKKSITLKEALCGFSFDITHLNGKLLQFNNKVNSTIIKPQFKKVLQGLGMIREKVTGNLVIEFDVVFPESLTKEQVNGLQTIL